MYRVSQKIVILIEGVIVARLYVYQQKEWNLLKAEAVDLNCAWRGEVDVWRVLAHERKSEISAVKCFTHGRKYNP